MSLVYLILISGILGKSKELDILPPPPPFPEIGKLDKAAEDVAEQRNKVETEKSKSRKEKQEKLKANLRHNVKKEKLRKEREKARKQKTFDFLHSLGLVKTGEEKKEIIKEKARKQKELEGKKREEQRIKADEERRKIKLDEQKKKELERKKREEEKIQAQEERRINELEAKKQKELEKRAKIEERHKELQLKRRDEGIRLGELEKQIPEKKHIFRKILGKKKVDLELEKEIWGIGKEPVKEPKIEVTEIEETVKPEELEKSEEEIRKAIQGMKRKPSIVKGIFKRKEKEIIEIPEIMPRTYDKIDHVVLIEERIHKARLFLMDFRFNEAKNVYIEIMRMYKQLESKKRAKVYEDIKELYYERKSAEKFAK